jgi:hypothetical protein
MSIALFRIGLGLLLLQNALLLFPDSRSFFSRESLLSQDSSGLWWQTNPHIDLFMIAPDSTSYQFALLIIYSTLCLFVALGLFTRLSCILAWILNQSIYCHFPLAASEVDVLCKFALMALCFSSAGQALSFDNIIRSFHQEDWRSAGFKAALTPQWPLRMLQIQICVACFFTGVCQLNNPDWLDGKALLLLSRNEDLAWFHMPFVFDNTFVSRCLTWVWMLFELSFPFLIWIKEVRYWLLGAGIALHVLISLGISTPLYHSFFILSSILFIEPEDLQSIWSAVKSFLTDGTKAYAFFDATKPADVCAVGVLHRLDVFNRFNFVESTIQLPTSLHHKRRCKITLLVDGEERRDGAALSYLLQHIPLLWLFLPFLSL